MISLLRLLKKAIITNSEQVKKTTDELLWAQIFNSSIAGSKWLKNQSISPGRWAMGYPALYLLYRIYNDLKPKQILEFGLGESSKLLYQYAAAHECDYTIVEHDQDWIDFFINEQPILIEHIFKATLGKTQYKKNETTIYLGLEEQVNTKKHDLIIIDGPFGSPEYSRIEILDLVKNNHLADHFIILMDDYDRKGEKNTIALLKEILEQKNIPFQEGIYSGNKDTIVICSPAFKFICEL